MTMVMRVMASTTKMTMMVTGDDDDDDTADQSKNNLWLLSNSGVQGLGFRFVKATLYSSRSATSLSPCEAPEPWNPWTLNRSKRPVNPS